MIRSRIGQQLLGLALMVVCGWLTTTEWQSALREGVFRPKVATLGAAFAVAGLGLLIFPFDYARLQAEHGVDRVQRFRHLTLEWKVWSFVTLAAGFGNWYAIAHWAVRSSP